MTTHRHHHSHDGKADRDHVTAAATIGEQISGKIEDLKEKAEATGERLMETGRGATEKIDAQREQQQRA